MISPNNPLGANSPVRAQMNELVGTIGRAAMNAQYPNDFEYYICSLELVDSLDRTVDFFTFPVMPSNISQSEPAIVNVKKTAGGITTLNTTTFQPVDIMLDGNFGRRLRLLFGTDVIDFAAIRHSVRSGDYGQDSQVRSPIFNTTVKTGYGCIKILQAIYRKARGLDDQGNPYRLYFYNPAVGDNFLVKPMNLQLGQNKQENMIWHYSLALKAIAPSTANNRSDKGSIGVAIAASILSSVGNKVVDGIRGDIVNHFSPQLI